MNDELFTLDTNILIYSVDLKADHRRDMAKLIIQGARAKPCFLTVQAISEFYAAVTRKRMMQPSAAGQVANDLMDVFRTIPASPNAVRTALATAAAGQASYWDALLVTTAAEAGCTIILTEDLADGSVMHGVRIMNPFDGAAQAPRTAALLGSD
jgi:predicted nucleic acid-binding protein